MPAPVTANTRHNINN